MKKVLIWLIRCYQYHISPRLPRMCRFTPTCSEYAVHALQEWGVICGIGLTAWRILRCNPFCKGGYDPVPVRKTNRRNK